MSVCHIRSQVWHHLRAAAISRGQRQWTRSPCWRTTSCAPSSAVTGGRASPPTTRTPLPRTRSCPRCRSRPSFAGQHKLSPSQRWRCLRTFRQRTPSWDRPCSCRRSPSARSASQASRSCTSRASRSREGAALAFTGGSAAGARSAAAAASAPTGGGAPCARSAAAASSASTGGGAASAKTAAGAACASTGGGGSCASCARGAASASTAACDGRASSASQPRLPPSSVSRFYAPLRHPRLRSSLRCQARRKPRSRRPSRPRALRVPLALDRTLHAHDGTHRRLPRDGRGRHTHWLLMLIATLQPQNTDEVRRRRHSPASSFERHSRMVRSSGRGPPRGGPAPPPPFSVLSSS